MLRGAEEEESDDDDDETLFCFGGNIGPARPASRRAATTAATKRKKLVRLATIPCCITISIYDSSTVAQNVAGTDTSLFSVYDTKHDNLSYAVIQHNEDNNSIFHQTYFQAAYFGRLGFVLAEFHKSLELCTYYEYITPSIYALLITYNHLSENCAIFIERKKKTVNLVLRSKYKASFVFPAAVSMRLCNLLRCHQHGSQKTQPFK